MLGPLSRRHGEERANAKGICIPNIADIGTYLWAYLAMGFPFIFKVF